MRSILIFLLNLYRWTISPLLGPCCRFHPSCSAYAKEAIQVHGPAHGLILTVRRLSHCHPFHQGGYDPVPRTNELNAQQPTLNIQRPRKNTSDLDIGRWKLVVGRSFLIPHWLGRPSFGNQPHTK